MAFDIERLPGMMDITSVSMDSTLNDVKQTCEIAKAYSCAATCVNPSYLSFSIKNTIGSSLLHAVTVGFPYGCDLTSVKVYAAKQLELVGAEELDVVMNVGAFLSGNRNYTRQDIEAVCDAVKIPVKVIIETALLDDQQIVEAALLVSKTKAAFIKTSTGFMGKPTTADMVRRIKDAVGDQKQIKASGGIRTLEDFVAIAEAGADRFGVGYKSALAVLHEIDDKLGREHLFD
ncbi:MAG: deoxyribose-phosphate aldolase [Christensenellaceae bacterium]|jgi:deoxyribose-phosphate aldolase